ncbi:MAG: hypothetical protein WCK89_17695 [bacterium]
MACHNRLPTRARHGGWLILVFFGAFCLFSIIHSGHRAWSDDFLALRAMENYVQTGDAVADTSSYNTLQGRNGHYYAKTEIGIKLLAMPAFLLGRCIDRLAPMPARVRPFFISWSYLLTCFTNVVLMSVLVVMGTAILTILRHSRPVAVAGALCAAFCSWAPVGSRTFLTNTLSAVALACGLLALVRSASMCGTERSARHLPGILAACACFLLLTARPELILFLPALALAWIYLYRLSFRMYVLPALGVLAGAGARLWYNYHRTGSPLVSEYISSKYANFFERNLLRYGFIDSLWSWIAHPSWSILLHSPLVVLFLVCGLAAVFARSLGKADTPEAGVKALPDPRLQAVFWALLIVPIMGMLACIDHLEPRYMSPVTFCLSLFGFSFAFTSSRDRYWLRYLACALGISGFVVQFAYCLASPYQVAHIEPWTTPVTNTAIVSELPGRLTPMFLQYYERFCMFPRPDWWLFYVLRSAWWLGALLLYGVSVVFFVWASTPWREIRPRRLLTAMGISVICVICLPPAFMYWLSTRRSLQLSIPVDNYPATKQSLGCRQVDVYRLGPHVVTDFLVLLPEEKAVPYLKTFSCDILSTRHILSTRARRSETLGCRLALGEPEKLATYPVDYETLPIDELPGSEPIWLSSLHQTVPWDPAFFDIQSEATSFLRIHSRDDRPMIVQSVNPNSKILARSTQGDMVDLFGKTRRRGGGYVYEFDVSQVLRRDMDNGGILWPVLSGANKSIAFVGPRWENMPTNEALTFTIQAVACCSTGTVTLWSDAPVNAQLFPVQNGMNTFTYEMVKGRGASASIIVISLESQDTGCAIIPVSAEIRGFIYF